MDSELVVALKSSDIYMVGLAKSILEEAGIPFTVHNESLCLGAGYDALGTPAEILVLAEDSEEVRELLKPVLELEADKDPLEE